MSNEQNQSHIAAEVEISGTIKCAGPVRIDAKLEGDLTCGGDAVIGKSATIKGNLTVNSIIVEGAIIGNITAKDRIEFKSSAKITGDIKGKRLAVEDGASFIGKSEVNPSGAPVAQIPVTPKADVISPPMEEKAGLFGRR